MHALKAWIEQLDDASPGAPSFVGMNRHSQAGERLCGRAVARIVERRFAAVGAFGEFRGHTMRSEFVTSLAAAAVDALEISNETRHKSLEVMKRYARPVTIWKSNAAFKVGL